MHGVGVAAGVHGVHRGGEGDFFDALIIVPGVHDDTGKFVAARIGPGGEPLRPAGGALVKLVALDRVAHQGSFAHHVDMTEDEQGALLGGGGGPAGEGSSTGSGGAYAGDPDLAPAEGPGLPATEQFRAVVGAAGPGLERQRVDAAVLVDGAGLVVPVAVVEILVVVGDLAAAQPVDRHALVVVGEGGVSMEPGVNTWGARERSVVECENFLAVERSNIPWWSGRVSEYSDNCVVGVVV